MSLLVLHIGLPKTATSFLQEIVFPKQINYYKYYFNKDFGNISFIDVYNVKNWDKIKLYLTENTLVSDETYIFKKIINGVINEKFDGFKELEIFLKCLRKNGIRTKIILVRRKESELLSSMYAQAYQAYFRKAIDFKSFVESFNPKKDLHKSISSKYLTKIISKTYPEAKILNLEYSQFVTDKDSFLDKILRFVEVPESNILKIYKNKQVNKRSVNPNNKIIDPLSLKFIIMRFKFKIFGLKPLFVGKKLYPLLDKIIFKKAQTINFNQDDFDQIDGWYNK